MSFPTAILINRVFFSAWYGGHLVYHHGMRVRGTELAGTPEDVKFPGDTRMAQALASTAGDEA